MRWLSLRRSIGRTRTLRVAVRKTAGGVASLIGAAIVIFALPVWIWKFVLGAGLAWLGAFLFSLRD